MSKRLQKVDLFCDAAQFARSEEIDFHVWFSPGFLMQQKPAHQKVLSLHRETKFIIGFDFAVTLSSPESFLRSFRHHFRTICRTEMANGKQTQKMIPFITCEVSLGQYVCELVFGVNEFDLDFWVHIDSIEQPIKSNSVGPGNESHCRASSLHNHLITASLSSNTYNKALMRRLDV